MVIMIIRKLSSIEDCIRQRVPVTALGVLPQIQ